jgi:signal transduction histidine kinase
VVTQVQGRLLFREGDMWGERRLTEDIIFRGSASPTAPPSGGAASEAQRERAVQNIVALGEMTAGLAHDFRNILATIDSGLRLAEKSAPNSEQARISFAAARDGVDRGVRLTSQLLMLAKHSELEFRVANVNELLRSLELFLRYAAGLQVTLSLRLGDIPPCLVENSQFSAAILNLVLNGRDAMPSGGEITITSEEVTVQSDQTASTAAPGTYVGIRVSDNGQGMSPEVLARIFDPLFTTKGDKGTGLGVPQVCAFMRSVDGRVDVTSEPGGGTTFELRFPALSSKELQPSSTALTHAE